MTILKKIIPLKKKSLRKVIKLKAMILVQHMCLFFFPLSEAMRTSCTPSRVNMVFLGGQFVMIRLQTFLHYGEIWFLRFGLCEEFSHPWFISTFNACYINSKGSFNILLSLPPPPSLAWVIPLKTISHSIQPTNLEPLWHRIKDETDSIMWEVEYQIHL